MLRKFDGPLSGLLLSADLLLLFVFATPTAPSTRHASFVVLASVWIYLAFYTTTGKPSSDYGIASYYMTRLFAALDFLVLTGDPQRDLWPVRAPKFADRTSLWGRLKWAIALFPNPRGTSWNFEARQSTPPSPSFTSHRRLGFLAYQLSRAALAFLAIDLLSTLKRVRPALHAGGSLAVDGPVWQAAYVATWYWNACAGMVLGHAVCAIGAVVVLGQGEPEDWPGVFGGMVETYTLRKFWGRSWHQCLRRWLTQEAKFITRTLGLSPGKTVTTYTELFLVFFLSGFVHFIGSYAMLRSVSDALPTLYFFLLNAAVIMLEDGLIHLGKQAGVKDSFAVRLVGYAWTWSWMVALAPVWLNQMVHAGLMDPGEEPALSILDGLLTGTWFVSKGTGVGTLSAS